MPDFSDSIFSSPCNLYGSQKKSRQNFLYLIFSNAPPPPLPLACPAFAQFRSNPVVCKVGITTDVHGRLRQLKTGNPYDLHVASTWPVGDAESAKLIEKSIHESAAQFRLSGEWFCVDASLISFIVDNEMCLHCRDAWRLSAAEAVHYFVSAGYYDSSAADIVAMNFDLEAAA